MKKYLALIALATLATTLALTSLAEQKPDQEAPKATTPLLQYCEIEGQIANEAMIYVCETQRDPTNEKIKGCINEQKTNIPNKQSFEQPTLEQATKFNDGKLEEQECLKAFNEGLNQTRHLNKDALVNQYKIILEKQKTKPNNKTIDKMIRDVQEKIGSNQE